jgi:hypothetical protein
MQEIVSFPNINLIVVKRTCSHGIITYFLVPDRYNFIRNEIINSLTIKIL